ncbi:GNAT family N-acetyltransferase [Salibacterium aidingense]|uniref:GNAT family N-acetyltransferase n=1 Tax=Salibacterium aidingense TaxID=384933 RepID=UPI003BC3CF79
MGPILRKAENKDIPAIQSVAEVSWTKAYENLIPSHVQKKYLDTAYSHAALAEKLASDIFFVGEEIGEVIAFANLHQSEMENDLTALYVHPLYHSQGLGRALLEKVKAECSGEEKLVVYLEQGNNRAEKFYYKMGFREIETFTETLFGHTFQTKKMVL